MRPMARVGGLARLPGTAPAGLPAASINRGLPSEASPFLSLRGQACRAGGRSCLAQEFHCRSEAREFHGPVSGQACYDDRLVPTDHADVVRSSTWPGRRFHQDS